MIQRMTYAQYESLPGLRHSALSKMADSALACRWAQDHPSPDTSAMAIGRAVHSMVLEPSATDRAYTVYDGTRSGGAWKAFAAEHAGETILSRTQMENAQSMAAAVHANPDAERLLAGLVAEVSVTWDEGGIACKGRLDGVAPLGIVDLKTTRRPYNREHGGFPSEFANYSYHSSLSWYQHGLEKNEGTARPVFVIAAQNVEPWEVGVYAIPPLALSAGTARWQALLAQFRACQANGVWPGFAAAGPITLELPTWAAGNEPIDMEGLTDGDF